MRPTNYSHESQLSGDKADMQKRFHTFTAGAFNVRIGISADHPDLFQPAAELHAEALQLAGEAGAQPRPVTSADVRPRTATAGNLIALTAKEQQLAEQRAMGVDALARANQEAL